MHAGVGRQFKMSDGGDDRELTFRDAFGSSGNAAARYADADDFEEDSDEPTPEKQPAKRHQPAPTAAMVTAKPGSVNELVERALASGQWRKQHDAGSNKYYYYNVLTRRTTWDLAKELAPTSDLPPPISADPNASLPTTPFEPGADSFRMGLPSLQLEGSFGGSSAVGAKPSAQAQRKPAAAAAAAAPAAAPDTDEEEDDATARDNIIRRGGHVPIASGTAGGGGGGGNLFHSVAKYKAFESGSEGEGASRRQSDGSSVIPLKRVSVDGSAQQPPHSLSPARNDSISTPAAVTAPEGKKAEVPAKQPAVKSPGAAPTAAADAPTASVAAKPAVAAAARRPTFDTDSDFSTASQMVAKVKQEQQTKVEVVAAPPPAAAAAPTTTHPSLQTMQALSTTHTGPPSAAVYQPLSAPSGPSLTHHHQVGPQSHPFAAVPSTTMTAAVPHMQSLAHPYAHRTPSSQFATGQPMSRADASAGPPQQQSSSAARGPLQDASEALENLVRAYAHLRHPDSGGDRGARVEQRIADAVRLALADDFGDDEGAQGRTHQRHRESSRGRVTHLLQQHRESVRGNALWGRATQQPARIRGASNADGAEDQVESAILDVVLGLYSEHGLVATHPTTISRAKGRHSDPEPTATPYVLDVPAIAPFGTSALGDLTATDLREGSVQELVAASLDKYVVSLVKKVARTASKQHAQAFAAAVRVVLLDAGGAVQSLATAAVRSGVTDFRVPLPPASVCLIARRLPYGDEALSRIVAQVLHCLPLERLDASDAGSASTASGGVAYRLEFWVGVSHLWDLAAALTATCRAVDLTMSDSYAVFAERPTNTVDRDDQLAVAAPDVPVIEARILPSFHEKLAKSTTTQAPAAATAATTASTRFTGGMVDDDAVERVLFVANKLADEVYGDLSTEASTKHALAAAAVPKVFSQTAELRVAATRRSAVETAVANTLGDLLNDGDIRAAVKRKTRAAATVALEQDPHAARLDAAQDKVNRLVERLRYELQFTE
jgi:hypothetical protein